MVLLIFTIDSYKHLQRKIFMDGPSHYEKDPTAPCLDQGLRVIVLLTLGLF